MYSFLFSVLALAEPEISVVYKTEDKVGFWMSKQSGVILYPETELFYTPNGYVAKQDNGYKHIHILGGYSFLTTLPETAIPISKAKGIEQPKGYRIEEKKYAKGSHFYLHKKDGSKSIIGRGQKTLVPYQWFSFDTKPKNGFKKPDESFNWAKEKESYLFQIPPNSNVVSYTKATESDIAEWNNHVQKFAPKTKITHGAWANLDLDPEPEGIACGVGYKFDACFIYDTQTQQWHGTPMKWNLELPPLFFQHSDGTYIAYRSHPKSQILRVLYFNGTYYETVFFRPPKSKKKK